MAQQNVCAKVPIETLKVFEEAMPMQGSKTWFVQACFSRFVELYKEGKIESGTSAVDGVLSRIQEEL